RLAGFRAEVIGFAVVLARSRGFRRGDLHTAHDVAFHVRFPRQEYRRRPQSFRAWEPEMHWPTVTIGTILPCRTACVQLWLCCAWWWWRRTARRECIGHETVFRPTSRSASHAWTTSGS